MTREARRRLVAGGLLLAIGIVAMILVVELTSGAGSPAPRYVPPGGRAQASGAPAPRLTVPAAPHFHPPAGAVRAANAMPLTTRVAQLFLVGVPGGDPTAAGATLGAAPWGGVVLSSVNGGATIGTLVSGLRAALPAPAGSRPLIAAVQPGGPGTAFPQLPPRSEATLGAAGDPAAARDQALLAGHRLRSLGIAMTLAPWADVDVAGGALSGRLFGTDPQLVARFTAAAVAGYAAAGEIAAVGHFPGEGSASADPDAATASATVGSSLSALRASDLLPFAAVSARVPVVEMSNAVYAAFDGVTPASLLAPAVSLLRGELRFPGVVLSGDLDATLSLPGSTPASAAVAALRAGDDLLYTSGPPSEARAADAGLIAAARHSASLRGLVRQALLHDLTLKARYGLLGQ